MTPVGKFFDFVIDPETGKCEAIWVQSFAGMKVLFPEDISFWQGGIIKIHTENDLHDPDTQPRLKEIFDREVPIIKARVFQDKANLGRVLDFSFDTISPRILTLIVGNQWWPFGSKRIINHKHIVAITDKGIEIDEPIDAESVLEEEPERKNIRQVIQEPEAFQEKGE